MKDSLRRILMFIVVIAGGLFIVILDIPLFYLLIGLLIIIVAILFASGTIPLGRLTTLRRKKTVDTPRIPVPPKPEAIPKKSGKKRKTGPENEGSFTLMKKGLSQFLTNIRTKKGKNDPESLAKSLSRPTKAPEKSPKSPLSEVPLVATPASSKPDADPLLPLVNEEIDSDLLDSLSLDDDLSMLDTINPEIEVPPVLPDDVGKLDITIDDEDATITIDEDNADEVSDILAQNVEDIANSHDQGLGGQELDTIRLDNADSLATEDRRGASSSWLSSSDLDEVEEDDKGDEFSFGGDGASDEDDLLASLKSDIKSIKKNDEDSLVRDLKDVKVPAVELEKELSSVIDMLNRTSG